MGREDRDLHIPGRGTVKCCAAQLTSVWEDPEKTLKKAEPWIRDAAGRGAALICFPEQFATGWDPCSAGNIQDANGSIVTTIRQFAREYSIAIIGSFRERHFPGPRNTAIAVGSTGEILATYAKIHLFTHAHEDCSYVPGSELATFRVGSLTCGLALCYDLRFPALFRLYAQQGVHAVFVPAAWPASRIRHWELFIAARAAENQLYVAGVNTTGETPVDWYTGASMTADPTGAVISRAGAGEAMLESLIDPGFVEEIRRSFPVEPDRKDALYNTLFEAGRHRG